MADFFHSVPVGVIERPTHASTLQDLARYEVPGHRFIDLSEPSFGVSILTDCKYGYSVHDRTMRGRASYVGSASLVHARARETTW